MSNLFYSKRKHKSPVNKIKERTKAYFHFVSICKEKGHLFRIITAVVDDYVEGGREQLLQCARCGCYEWKLSPLKGK